ncbi:hypothetical protein [Sphingomonas sp.]|uniref:hypothetical protein n=1 Tax=Sphingomonas sp. TaxID=28214 RepID=UPI003AFFC78D
MDIMRRSTGRRRGRTILWVIPAILLILVGTVAMWVHTHRYDFSISVGDPGASALLKGVVEKSGLSGEYADAVETISADGTTPDTARQTLHVDQPSASITAAVRHACRSLGLDSPDPMAQRSDPSAVCMGQWHDQFATVGLRTDCAGRCKATVTAELN